MRKITWLSILVLACGLAPTFASAQEGARVAVMPVQMSADGAQLEQLGRLTKGLTGVLVTSLADQGLMALTMGDNALTVGDAAAQAQAREMGADYLFTSRVNKVGEKYNMTGQLVALSGGQSSKRVTVTGDATTQLPVMSERLVQMTTDHLFGGGSPVSSVNVTGNTMLDSQAILNTLRIQPGGTYNDAKVTSDIKRIYALGYFEDVQVRVHDQKGGKAVTYVVKERSQLGNIVFKGNKKFDSEELMKVVGIKPHDIPSERNIADSVENIKKLYADKGFPNVKVMTSIQSGGDGKGLLVYDIAEGGKIYIKNIEFDGNEFYSDWTLSRQIETSTRNFLISWISGSGKLNQEKLSGDSQKLESYYQNSGFLQAQVGDPIVSDADNDGGLTITFPIVEGQRFKVGEVTIGGQLLPDDDMKQLMKYVEIRKETWFSREVMQEDIKALQTYYSDKGYAHNTVEPRITGPHDGDKLDVEFAVQPNNKVYFDRITIVGNDKTRDKVIRRQLSVVEGDQFSATKIQNSQSNLMRSTYFEQVNLVPGPSDTDDKMNLRVEVKERPTGSFQIGGGYSNYNSLFGVIKLTQDNLFGYGRRASVEANVGSKNALYNISFTDPWVFDIPLTMGVDIFRYENKYDYYTKASNGAALRAGYPIWANFYLSARYSWEKIDITDVASSSSQYLKSMQDYSTDSVFTVTLRRDTRNHFFFPNRGSVARFSYAKASEFLGGDTNFSRYEAEGAYWIPFPFFKGASLMGHGEIGYMTDDGDVDGHTGLPTYEKYMIGGINSVRGYDWYSISPKDPVTGETIGGEKMMVFNVELSFPLLRDEGLYAVAFYDAGQVWDKDGSYDFNDLRRSYGGGLRYLSPMGPFRIEYGRALDREEGDPAGRWEFTMGSMF